MTPIFTIIIATYNAASLLPSTLGSITAQTFRDFNVIIQDGASSDDTITVAQTFIDKLPTLLLHCEKDTGIYDAWNKALDKWQDKLGKWILFLGAGDELYNKDVLSIAADYLNKVTPYIMYAGGAIQTVTTDGVLENICAYQIIPLTSQWQMVPHNAIFHRKLLFQTNRFDTKLKIRGDYDFFCRHWTNENGNCQLPLIITKVRKGGVSSSPATTLRTRWETAKIKFRYFPLQSFLFYTIYDIAKGITVTTIHYTLGKKSSVVLNWLRNLRGLPPW